MTRSMTVLSTLAENRLNHRYLDLTAVTAICVRVLQEYPTTLACLKPALNVLETVSSKEAVLRLSDHCSVLHNVLQINLGSGVLCEQVIHICKPVAQESHVFRVQCIKSGMLQDLLEAVTRHSNHLQLLFSACDIFISLSEEPLLENSALTSHDHRLHLTLCFCLCLCFRSSLHRSFTPYSRSCIVYVSWLYAILREEAGIYASSYTS